jgi:hypothetical protein
MQEKCGKRLSFRHFKFVNEDGQIHGKIIENQLI